MWLPETAVDLATLRIARRGGRRGDDPRAVAGRRRPTSTTGVPYRVDVGRRPPRHRRVLRRRAVGRGLVRARGSTADADRFARERVGAAARRDRSPDGAAPSLVIATDGELYGHHQSFRDLFLHRLVAPRRGDPGRGVRRGHARRRSVAEPAAARTPRSGSATGRRGAATTACSAGPAECPDARDGRWKAPLRAALERLAGGDRRRRPTRSPRDLPGLDDPWAARDAYVDVVIGAQRAATRSPPRASGRRLDRRRPARGSSR